MYIKSSKIALAQFLLLSSVGVCSYDEMDAARGASRNKIARVAVAAAPAPVIAFDAISDKDLNAFFQQNILSPVILDSFAHDAQGLPRLMNFLRTYNNQENRIFVMVANKVHFVMRGFMDLKEKHDLLRGREDLSEAWEVYKRCLGLCVAFEEPDAIEIAKQLPWYFKASKDYYRHILKQYAPDVFKLIQDPVHRKALGRSYIEALKKEVLAIIDLCNEDRTPFLPSNYERAESLIEQAKAFLGANNNLTSINYKTFALLYSKLAQTTSGPDGVMLKYKLLVKSAENYDDSLENVKVIAPSTLLEAARAHENASHFAPEEARAKHAKQAAEYNEKVRVVSVLNKNAIVPNESQVMESVIRTNNLLEVTPEQVVKNADLWNQKIMLNGHKTTIEDYQKAVVYNSKAAEMTQAPYMYLKQLTVCLDKIIALKGKSVDRGDFGNAAKAHKRARDAASQDGDKKFHDKQSMDYFSKLML